MRKIHRTLARPSGSHERGEGWKGSVKIQIMMGDRSEGELHNNQPDDDNDEDKDKDDNDDKDEDNDKDKDDDDVRDEDKDE